ncbi:MAG: helix-turn-helix domain-containing protein [Candidatus Woesearchaeota archaeon]
MDISQLEKIGLKEKEARIYIELLKEGPSLANHIAKKTNILRSSIYDYFDILLDKGFVSYAIKSGKKYFQAVDPRKIIDNFEEKKKKEEDSLNQIVPELAKFQNLALKKTDVEVFEGKDGMKTAMSYMLKEKPKEMMIYGSSGASYKIIPFFMKHWHDQRAKQGSKLRIIYNNAPESFKRIKQGPSLKLAKIKFLPIKNISFTGTIVCRNKVLLTIWNKEDPLAILIESKDISKSYKDNFEVLWISAFEKPKQTHKKAINCCAI